SPGPRVFGELIADGSVLERHLGGIDGDESLLRVSGGPSGPPPDVGEGGWTVTLQVATQEIRPGLRRIDGGNRPAEPLLGQSPPILARLPGPDRSRPHHEPVHAEDEEETRPHRNTVDPFARSDLDLPGQIGDGRDDL